MAPALRRSSSPGEIDLLEPLWNALQEHHGEVDPVLAGSAPKRENAEAWRRRRQKYERWLEDPETFFVIAEENGDPIGYAFVTVGPGYASWASGDRVAELETLSVQPSQRGRGVGESLTEAVWERLGELGIDDLSVTTVRSNAGARRFYEARGFEQAFVTYYARRDRGR